MNSLSHSEFHRRRPLRLETLEDRSLLSVTPITPAQAITQLNAEATAVAQQAATLTGSIQTNQNGLLLVAHQVDATNFSQIQAVTQQGNTQAALADLTERTVITAAEARITTEFNQTIAPLTAANQKFQTQTSQLVLGVRYGIISPTVALATQQVDLVAYEAAAGTAVSQSLNESQLELANVAQLVNSVEGVAGQTNLGTFHGSFNIQSASGGGLLHTYLGVVTTHLTLGANLLQGTFTAAPGDYLQALDTSPTIGPAKVVNQPVTGGTITATVSPASDAQGFSVHGTVQIQLGAVGGIPAHSETFQIAANLTAQHFLVGVIMSNGQTVGSFDWGVQ